MHEKTAETTLASRLEAYLSPNGILDKVAEESTLLLEDTEEKTLMEDAEEEVVADETPEAVVETEETEETEKVATDPQAEALVEILSHPEVKRGFQETLDSRRGELEEAILQKAAEYIEYYSDQSK